jgi:hypothetical protein
MDNKAAYAYLIALAIPFITGLLAKCSWPSGAKFGILVVLCFGLGIGTVLITNGQSWAWNMPFLVSIVVAAEIYYRLFIKSMPKVKQWLADHLNKDKTACIPQ